MNQVLQTRFGKHRKNEIKGLVFISSSFVAGLFLFAWLTLSCGGLNLGALQPQDICQCSPLGLGIEYRHAEKHVPISGFPALDLTVTTMYTWTQTQPTQIDPPRQGMELQAYDMSAVFLQEAHINSEDCDIHLEISDTANKLAQRVIVETPVETGFCGARKNIQTQLAQHGFTLDATHGGELPQGLAADVVGMAFQDFDHTAIGLGRGSAQVQTVWELHPATVTLK